MKVAKCSIDDPRMSANARKVLRTVLEIYARKIAAGTRGALTEMEATNGVIELFETGFLMIETRNNGDMRVVMCLPEDAPQMDSELTYFTQVGRA